MIRYFIFVCMLFSVSFVVSSQNKPFFCNDKNDSFLESEVYAIIGTSTMWQNYAEHVPSISDINTSPGCGVGIGAKVQFEFRDFFALGTQLDFMARNNKYSMVIIDTEGKGSQNSVFVSNRSYSASVPVYASVRFNIADNVRWNIDAGGYFSLGLGGYQKADTYTTSINDLGQMVSTYKHYDLDYYNEQHPLIHAIDDVDFGLMFRTGLLFYDHYNVGLEARISTKNATADEGIIHPKMYNHLFAMKIGYQF